MRRAAALLLVPSAILMTPALPGGADCAAAQTVTWRHPVGYSFEHPADWRVEPRAEGTVILPGDVALAGAGNALEIALSSQSAPGIGRPDDPQLTIRWDAGRTERAEYAVCAREDLPHLRIGASGSGARFYRRVN